MLYPRIDTPCALERTQTNNRLSRFLLSGVTGKRHHFRAIICVSLILGVFVALSLFVSTSAQHRDSGLNLNIGAAATNFVPVSLMSVESISTFGSDCVTPENVYLLGETVCASQTGAPLPFFGFRQRRFQWVSPDGTVVQLTDITTNPQSDEFAIPTSGNFAQVGTWSVRIIKNNGNTVTLDRFVVRDPANVRSDLSVGKFGPLEVKGGNNASYSINVTNRGPDAAATVELTDDVPSNMSFVSAVQTTGPTFTCTNPQAGGTGTSTCTIDNLAAGAAANFTFVYEVTPGTAAGTTIENTATVTTSTTELSTTNNSATAPVTVTGQGSGGGECVLTCPEDIIVVAGANQSGATITYTDPTASGTSCGAISCSQASGTFFPVGTTTVVCAAETGDPCSFTVTVQDTQNPTISCPSNITVSEDPGTPGAAIVDYPDPVASDNSGIVDVNCTPPAGSSFPVGTTPVTCTATDEANNSASCTFNVTVTGNACTIDCPLDIVVIAPEGTCQAMVTLPPPLGTTTCTDITSSHNSGMFPLGDTIVTLTAGSGQSCSYTVTVRDNNPPTLTSCAADIVVDAASGACTANVTPGAAPTATDDCSTPTVVGARSDGEPLSNLVYQIGTTTITWTATDSSGNTSSCQQNITVRDVTPPTATVNVPPAVATVTADADCQALIPDISEFVVASDTCTPASALTITQSPVAETVVGAGVHVITITVLEGDPDGQNNSITRTATFTVLDGTPPVLTVNGANPLVVECHTSLVDPGATATDTCVANPVVNATDNVNVNVPGNYTITYTTTDGTNTVTATRDVTVVDTIAPVVTVNGANPMTVECHTSFTDPGASAADACDGNTPVSVTGSVNVDLPGAYTLTYTSSDGTNTATATRTVNVVDTTNPTITFNGITILINGIVIIINGQTYTINGQSHPIPSQTFTLHGCTITLNGQTIIINGQSYTFDGKIITLWAPNHSYQTIKVSDLIKSASDGCDSGVDLSDVVITKATSDETENGNGDGNTLNDIIIAANCKSVQLRAERSGNGNGRVYTIHYRVSDAAGNSTVATRQIKVPKLFTATDSGVQYTVNSTCP